VASLGPGTDASQTRGWGPCLPAAAQPETIHFFCLANSGVRPVFMDTKKRGQGRPEDFEEF
jgi:hypothetical protein